MGDDSEKGTQPKRDFDGLFREKLLRLYFSV
jgi:hypothetical protein